MTGQPSRISTRLIERVDVRGDGHRGLAPLDIDGVRGIVRLYVGQDETDAPVESMARASQGVPGRVHEVVSEWARSEASRRLAAAAEFLAAGRERHASDLEFANNVIGLKLGRLYSVEGPRRPRRPDLPLQRPRRLRTGRLRLLLRPGAAGRRAGRSYRAGRSARRRGRLGQRQVLGDRRGAAPVPWRRFASRE